MTRILLTAFAAILLAFQINLAKAGTKPPISPSASHAYGKTYQEWAADWLKWALSIPAPSNPILDSTGAFAAVGQTGKVWFLAGTTGEGAVPPVVRSITVPTGTPLFFPIVNYFWVNTPEYGDPQWSLQQEANARGIIGDVIDSAVGLTLKIDGVSVPSLDDFRVQSTATECSIPAQASANIFGLELMNNPYHCVADGYWALIPPLAVGSHTVHFTGGIGAPSTFSLDVTYNIIVKPSHKITLPHHP